MGRYTNHVVFYPAIFAPPPPNRGFAWFFDRNPLAQKTNMAFKKKGYLPPGCLRHKEHSLHFVNKIRYTVYQSI